MSLFRAMHAQGKSLAVGLEAANALPNHYQDLLPDFIRQIRPDVVVETGVATGISSDRILGALDANEHGHLYSVDPQPCAGLFEIDHPRWKTYKYVSREVLAPIFRYTGAWDMFLHDSEHGVWCQTFEYELAWRFVRPGGYILSDDLTWGSPPHDAWGKFCARRGVRSGKFGCCGVVRKPLDACAVPTSHVEIEEANKDAIATANLAAQIYRAIPGATDRVA